jgi:hypothetical protein
MTSPTEDDRQWLLDRHQVEADDWFFFGGIQ